MFASPVLAEVSASTMPSGNVVDVPCCTFVNSYADNSSKTLLIPYPIQSMNVSEPLFHTFGLDYRTLVIKTNFPKYY